MSVRSATRTANAAPPRKFRDGQLRAVEKAVRRIVRAHDIQSRALVKASGLTAAQLMLIKGIAELGEVTSVALSAYADISPATVVTVLDNLEHRGLVERYRSGSDRRVVHTRLTQRGAETAARAPEPMGAAFAKRFRALDPGRRAELVAAVIELGNLMSGEPNS